MKIKTKLIEMDFATLLCFIVLASSFIPSQVVNAANVTVTLYVYAYDGSTNGQALSGVLVTGKDGNGVSFSQTTNVSGYISITGATGAWVFNASTYGYQTNIWATYILSSNTLKVVLIPSAQTTSSYAY